MPLGKNESDSTQLNVIDDLMKMESAPGICFSEGDKKGYQVLSPIVLLYF